MAETPNRRLVCTYQIRVGAEDATTNMAKCNGIPAGRVYFILVALEVHVELVIPCANGVQHGAQATAVTQDQVG